MRNKSGLKCQESQGNKPLRRRRGCDSFVYGDTGLGNVCRDIKIKKRVSRGMYNKKDVCSVI